MSIHFSIDLGWRPSLVSGLEAIATRLEVIASRCWCLFFSILLEAIAWRPSLLGWRSLLVAVGVYSFLLDLGWRPSLISRLEAIATGWRSLLVAVGVYSFLFRSRLEAIAN